MKRYRGVIIAEGLDDPMLINGLSVYRAEISKDGKPLDYAGTKGRWHAYFVQCSRNEIENLRPHVIRGWYAHFWSEKKMLVAYSNRLFEIDKADKSTWRAAVEHGRQQGIPERELDFPTD